MLLANEVTAIAPSPATSGFKHEDIAVCLDVARRKSPIRVVSLLAQQGGCSLTLCADSTSQNHDDRNDTIIIQFRLAKFALSPTVVHESQAIYGSLVPAPLWFEDVVASHGAQLQVCAMTSISGVRFSEVQPKVRHLSENDVGKMQVLVEGMAKFFATGWNAARVEEKRRMSGKVGSSLMQRLRKLERELPVEWMRNEAGMAADALEGGGLDCLPVVLNHGDLLPSNIMVDPESWELNGLVDWAEAEYLPFGMSLYGIEHILRFEAKSSGLTTHPRFIFYDQASILRDSFWASLSSYIHELSDPRIRTATLLSRDIGVLLWHGFAWDDGKIDRVVNELDDRQEVAYLEALLRTSAGQRRSKL